MDKFLKKRRIHRAICSGNFLKESLGEDSWSALEFSRIFDENYDRIFGGIFREILVRILEVVYAKSLRGPPKEILKNNNGGIRNGISKEILRRTLRVDFGENRTRFTNMGGPRALC